MEAGANAFVVKSSNYDDFRALVRRVGQFWAGDCFTSRRCSDARSDESMTALPRAVSGAGREDQIDVAETGGMGRVKTILLAEDDAGHVTLIKRALTRANIDCTVDVVPDGVAAIDYLFVEGAYADRHPALMPDLILLDLNMPKMNGRQVLQTLRKARTQEHVNLPPVVVLTSSDEESEINDAYNLGAQSFVRKPVQHGRFMQAVQQTTLYWLGLHESSSRDGSAVRQMKTPR
jgi:two-component system response regulator